MNRTNKPRVLIAQLGARRHYQQPLLFHQWGILESFYTDFYAGEILPKNLLCNSFFKNSLPQKIRKVLDRYDPTLDEDKIIHFPNLAIAYRRKLNKETSQIASIHIWMGNKFCTSILNRGFGEANTVYGFNCASLELFRAAKSKGIRCILDQTIAERSLLNSLLLEEQQKWKRWSTKPFTLSDSDIELVQREREEQQLADHIICGSTFVKNSLIDKGIDEDKISIISMGKILKNNNVEKTHFFDKNSSKKRDELKILFAGEVGLRKGIPYLLMALQNLKSVIPFSCKIAGNIALNYKYLEEFKDVCSFIGRVPRSRMNELYSWADVFVLPSICEGSAMVTYEALNYNLPIITTPNSGSIVKDNVDGFIIPIRADIMITQKLIDIYNRRHDWLASSKQDRLMKIQKSSESKFKEIFNISAS